VLLWVRGVQVATANRLRLAARKMLRLLEWPRMACCTVTRATLARYSASRSRRGRATLFIILLVKSPIYFESGSLTRRVGLRRRCGG